MAHLGVIIPLYNQEEYIEQCVRSIQNQTVKDLEIIVVDDGSSDNGGSICDRLAEEDNRITVIHQENKGLAGARYAGLCCSKSQYVTFVDGDDFITSGAYDDVLDYINNDYDEIFYEISRYFDDENIKREYHIIEEGTYDRERIKKEIYPKLIWDFERKTPGIECSQCVRIVKKELVIDAYNELNNKSFYYGEDIVITYPLIKKINKLAVISRSFYMHRQRIYGTAPEYISVPGYFDEINHMYSYLRYKMKAHEAYDFTKQIDYMYMYSVNLKKWSYNDYEYQRDFLFPFDKVRSGLKVILYGAGLVGRTYFTQLEKLSYCAELLWVDRDAEKMNDSKIKSLKKLDKEYFKSFDFIVIGLENKKIIEEVSKFLLDKGYSQEKIIY